MERRTQYLKTYLDLGIEIVRKEGTYYYEFQKDRERHRYIDRDVMAVGQDVWSPVTFSLCSSNVELGSTPHILYIDYAISENQEGLKVMHASLTCHGVRFLSVLPGSKTVRCIFGLCFDHGVLTPYFTRARSDAGLELLPGYVNAAFIDAVCDLAYIDFFVRSLP